MVDPVSSQSKVRTKLAEYLTLETNQYYADIDWLYYYQEHDSSMSPRGAIFIDKIARPNNYPANLDSSTKNYAIHLRLKISKNTVENLLDSMADWEEELSDRIVKKLQCNGYDGFFQGIHPDPRQPSILEVNKNQDDGGCGNLHLFLLWTDHGSVTGDQIGEFL